MKKQERVDKLIKFLRKEHGQYIQTFYDVGSLAGDYRINEYSRDGIQVLYAPGYDYIEIYNLTPDEIQKVKHYGYDSAYCMGD